MSDDDKKGPDADPWANLDAEAAGPEGDAFAFAFDEPEDAAGEKAPESAVPPLEPWPVESSAAGNATADDTAAAPRAMPTPDEDAWDGIVAETIAAAGTAREIPLAVFPPADSEAAGVYGDVDAESFDGATGAADPDAEGTFGTEQSGIIAMADVTGGFGGAAAADDDFRARAAADASADAEHDPFDEAALARELADGATAESNDFGDPVGESPSEEVSFQAGAVGSSPFAESGLEPFGRGDESIHEESAAIPMVAGLATAGAAVAGAAVRPAAAPKKRGGGIGQLIGIVFGGLLAIPITFAILIWGFQKDPFKLARHVPPQLAFLLPQSLQPGAARPAAAAKKTSAPDLAQAKSLDDLAVADAGDTAAPADGEMPASADGAAPALANGDAPAPADGDDPAPADGAAPVPADGDAAGIAARTKPMADADGTAAGDAATAADGLAAAAVEPAMEPGAVAVPAPALDALDPVTPAAVAVAETVPLDLAGVEAAAAKAAAAYDSLAALPDGDDPARSRLLVGWYRQLARLGEELATLEHAATNVGRPLEDTPEAAGGVLERVRGDDAAVGDLIRLGGMWLTSQKRQSDGVVLVATVENVRRVGPYWSTRAAIADAGDAGATRSVAVISRTQPAADVGDRVLVSGVLFDGDAIWAVDVRPLAAARVSAGADGF